MKVQRTGAARTTDPRQKQLAFRNFTLTANELQLTHNTVMNLRESDLQARGPLCVSHFCGEKITLQGFNTS